MSAVVRNLLEGEAMGEAPGVTPAIKGPLESVSWLPCKLTLDVPALRFTIADLLALEKGAIVETSCHHNSDVPLRVNGVLIGWTEFETAGDRLAIRVTEML